VEGGVRELPNTFRSNQELNFTFSTLARFERAAPTSEKQTGTGVENVICEEWKGKGRLPLAFLVAGTALLLSLSCLSRSWGDHTRVKGRTNGIRGPNGMGGRGDGREISSRNYEREAGSWGGGISSS